jgi:chloride channel protein, CIC family
MRSATLAGAIMDQRSQTNVHGDRLRDFSADRRVLLLAAMALVTGTCGAVAAWALLELIALFTHLAYFHTLSTGPYHFAGARLGPMSIIVPVAGGVIVGLMARYGSEKIRGHGIPEALESILLGESRIAPRVAFRSRHRPSPDRRPSGREARGARRTA